MNTRNFSLPVSISEEDVKNALKPCIDEEIQRLQEMSQRGMDALGDAVDDKRRLLETKVDGLTTRVTQQIKDADKALEDLKDKVTKRANQFLIPISIVILLLGVIAIWATLGSTFMALRSQSTDALAAAEQLKADIASRETQLKDLSAQLATLATYKQTLTDLEGRTAKLESQLGPQGLLLGRMQTVEGSIKKTDGRVDTLTQMVAGKTNVSSATTVTSPQSTSTKP
jgi:hypothetical protein